MGGKPIFIEVDTWVHGRAGTYDTRAINVAEICEVEPIDPGRVKVHFSSGRSIGVTMGYEDFKDVLRESGFTYSFRK